LGAPPNFCIFSFDDEARKQFFFEKRTKKLRTVASGGVAAMTMALVCAREDLG
jgi:nitroreductase